MSTESPIFTVTEITAEVKHVFDSNSLFSNVSVQGEISNFKLYPSGHMYFTLKDATSKLKMVMFAGSNRRLSFIPQDGMQVIARGSISVYERDGQYQMTVFQMQEAGLGQLFLQLAKLKQKLEAEGLFAEVHKKPLPEYPKTIGVVTSPAGAVIRDIITTVKRRFPYANVLLFPAQVQGVEAPASLVHAIETMNRLQAADVLIVGRGGGSLEELWAFNDEQVVRAIFKSTIPIISAVGHETDVTLADFVADRRAPTPTAAAEMAVPDMNELLRRIEQQRLRLFRALKQRAMRAREHLQRLQRTPWLLQPIREIQQPMQALDFLSQQLRRAMIRSIGQYQEKLAVRYVKLDSLSPLKVMARGYSLIYDSDDRKLIRSVTEVAERSLIHVHMSDGSMLCNVQSVNQHVKNGVESDE